MNFYHEPFDTVLTEQEVESTTGYLSPGTMPTRDLNDIYLYPINESVDPYNPNLFTTVVSYSVSGGTANPSWAPTDVALSDAKEYGKSYVRPLFSSSVDKLVQDSGYSSLAVAAAASKLQADRGADVQSVIVNMQTVMSDLASVITDIEAATDSSGIQEIIDTLSTPEFTVFVVTVSGGYFYVDGVQQDSLDLETGQTYRFNQADSTNAGHPLKIYDDAAKTTEITEGVTVVGTPGSVGSYTQFIPTTSGTFSYQCEAHADMGGDITVTGDDYTIPAESSEESSGGGY